VLKDLKKRGTKMKKLAILTLIMMISLFIFADMAQAGRVGNRQIKQQKRIH